MLPDTWLVVPCYNEAGRLLVEDLRAFVDSDPRSNIVLVNDGSSDGTGALIDAAAAASPGRIHSLHLPENRGKAEAVRQGLQATPGWASYCGFWDADLATPLSEVALMRDLLETRPQVDWIFGSRVMLLGRRISRRPLRHYLGRVFATGASMALRMPVYDTQCGAKLFRANDRLQRVLTERFRSRWIFDVEMLERLTTVAGSSASAAALVYEHPLTAWHDVGGSKVSFWAFVRAALELIGTARGVRRMPTGASA